MLQDGERDLQEEETQLFFGLIDKHRGTKRKMLNVQSTPSVEEAQAEARCESNGSKASIIIEESHVVSHTQWSLWMGPGFSDSEEEEEKETAAHISNPKDNTVGSFVSKMPKFPSEYGSDSCSINEDTVDNRIPPGQETTPSTTPLVPVNFQGFMSSKLLKSSNKKRTIK